jgi:hypothetical protein
VFKNTEAARTRVRRRRLVLEREASNMKGSARDGDVRVCALHSAVHRLFGLALVLAVLAGGVYCAPQGKGSSSVVVSVAALAFGNQNVGTASATQRVTFTNTGSAVVILSEVGIFGSAPADYTQGNTCGPTLAPAASCTVSVVFKPTATGPRYAAVFMSDNGVGSPQMVPLSGNGVGGGPTVSVSVPSSLSFGSVPVTPDSAAKTVTVTNTGAATLTFHGAPAVTGANEWDFGVTGSTCSTTLAAGAKCVVTITFTPSSLAVTESAVLTFSDNAGAGTQAVQLSGIGVHWIGLQIEEDAPAGATAFNVYRGTESGIYASKPVKACVSVATLTSCMDTDLSLISGTTYYYIVKAIIGGVEGGASNEASAVFP